MGCHNGNVPARSHDSGLHGKSHGMGERVLGETTRVAFQRLSVVKRHRGGPRRTRGQILRRDVLRHELAPILLRFRQGGVLEKKVQITPGVQPTGSGRGDERQGGCRRVILSCIHTTTNVKSPETKILIQGVKHEETKAVAGRSRRIIVQEAERSREQI